jgi:hypothetical protein
MDLTEGDNAKINKRQVSDKISFEQSNPGGYCILPVLQYFLDVII